MLSGGITLVALLLALFVVPAAHRALAQSPRVNGIGLDVTVGFGGRFRHAAWSPVAVDISHPAGFTGTLELAVPRNDLFSAARSYVRLIQPVSLQAGESRRFWFTVPLRGSPYPLTVTIKDRQGRIVASQSRELRGGVVPGSLMLVLDPAAAAWSFLAQTPSPGTPATPAGAPAGASSEIVLSPIRRPGDLPADALALSSASALLIRDTFPLDALSPEQVAAIGAYVRAGGHVLVTGGSSPPVFPLAWLSWLPEVTGRVSALPVGDALVPAWELYAAEGENSPGEERLPLWSSRPVGAGRATVIAFDPSSPLLAGEAGRPLREQAVRLALQGAPRPQGAEITDDDVWALLNQIEIGFGDNQRLTAVVIIYALGVTAIAILAWHRPRWHVLLALWIAVASWYAWDLTSSTGIRGQMGYAHVQLSRGLSPGVVLNRSYTLAVSLAGRPQNVWLTGPPPPAFPAPYRTDDDVVVSITPGGALFEGVLPTAPIRVYHDSFEEVDIRVQREPGGSPTLTIVNNSDYHLRYVHYIERRRLATLGDVPPRSTQAWTEAPARVASAGWMGMTLQTGLMRQDPTLRPEDVDIRLLALAADRGLGESLLQAEADRPFIVALVDPLPTIQHVPRGQSVRKRVLILPVFDAEPAGGGEQIGF